MSAPGTNNEETGRLAATDYVPLVASIDVGTTSSRVICFDKRGHEISKHQIEYSTSASRQRYTAVGQRRFSVSSTAPGTGSLEPLAPYTPNLGGVNTPATAGNTEPASGAQTPREPIYSSAGIKIEESKNLTIEDITEAKNKLGPTLSFPKPGWIECNPISILLNVLECLANTLDYINKTNEERIAHGEKPYSIRCIGIANMRETTIVWSKKTGSPIVNYGIVWNDTRNLPLINEKRAKTDSSLEKRFFAKTGLPLFSTYFSCSKLRWFLDNEPAVAKAYETGDLMFGTVDSWLIYHLTGRKTFITDVTNASRTGFMNLDTLDYDDELLSYWEIDRSKINLPKIVSSSEYYGDFAISERLMQRLTKQMLPETISMLRQFVSLKIPINGCLGDQSASLVGQMAYKKGSAKCTYGTGCFLLYNTGSQRLVSKNGALTTIGFWFPNMDPEWNMNKPIFALEGSIAVAGSVVQWLRDNLKLFAKSEDVGPLASLVPDSGGVAFVPAFSGLFAPYWDPDCRATIMGISQYTTASHIARAAVEGVCFQVRAILKAMSADAYAESKENSSETTNDKLRAENDTEDIDLLEDPELCSYEKSLFSTLSVDGGMSRSNEVMQIQADILGPCMKVRRSPVSESTALGVAIAANMSYKNAADRPLWKNLSDAKKWVFFDGKDKEERKALKEDKEHPMVFRSKSHDSERRQHWKIWETAVARSKGWLKDVGGEHTPIHDESAIVRERS